MELDTQQLMAAMVNKAAKVSSIALHHVHDCTCRHVAAAMQSIKTSLPEQLFSPPVVSPDQMAMILPSNASPTPLTLDEQEDDDGPSLTAEMCASIVDDCFDGISNDDVMMLSPPIKKMRIENAPTEPPAML
jgi:hypothetical protein